jgi:hypothetical protein
MLQRILQSLKYSSASFAALLAHGLLVPAHAQVMTASVIDEKMTTSEWNAYVSGIVEGLAHARYMRDGKQPVGSTCIRLWWEDGAAVRKVSAAFKRYPDKMPADIIGALVSVKCGA